MEEEKEIVKVSKRSNASESCEIDDLPTSERDDSEEELFHEFKL